MSCLFLNFNGRGFVCDKAQIITLINFSVMAYACTDGDKCTGSPFYGAYATADVPVEEPTCMSILLYCKIPKYLEDIAVILCKNLCRNA